MRYAKPKSIDEALALLGEGPLRARLWRMIAGGTDFYPAQSTRPLRDDVLDLNALDELRGIHREGGDWVIGARASWTDLLRHDLPPAFDALKQAAREVGSVQIQNVATVAGNLCNASPAADGMPPLLVLDAQIELASLRGRRRLPLREFVLGNRRTALAPDEMAVAVHVRDDASAGSSAFVKLGARRYLVISMAMAAARLHVVSERIDQAAISVGACSPVAVRMDALEHLLVGAPADPEHLASIISQAPMDALSPIDDVRASAGYRIDAAREIVARAVLRALDAERSARTGSIAA